MTPATGIGRRAVPQNGALEPLRRHPLLFFVVIAYAVSWAYVLPFLVLFPLPDVVGRTTPGSFGPTVAALIMTAVLAGKPGLRQLLRRCVLWRVNAVWYLFTFLGVPAIYVVGVLLAPGAAASFTAPPPTFWLLYPVLFLAGMVLGGPLGEESGWRGFALPRLQERWGPLAASVIVGLLWAAWHAPQYLRPEWAAVNGGLTPGGVGVFALGLVLFSVIVTWVFNHTRGTVLVAILLHASLNASQALMSQLFPAAGSNEAGPLIAFGLTALVVVVATRGRLGYARPGHAPDHPEPTALGAATAVDQQPAVLSGGGA
jgi:membrane protease YdiL (CAAX protease family)